MASVVLWTSHKVLMTSLGPSTSSLYKQTIQNSWLGKYILLCRVCFIFYESLCWLGVHRKYKGMFHELFIFSSLFCFAHPRKFLSMWLKSSYSQTYTYIPVCKKMKKGLANNLLFMSWQRTYMSFPPHPSPIHPDVAARESGWSLVVRTILVIKERFWGNYKPLPLSDWFTTLASKCIMTFQILVCLFVWKSLNSYYVAQPGHEFIM